MTIQMKAIEQYFHVVLFITLYKMVVSLKFNFLLIQFCVCRDGSFLVTGSGDSTARVFTVQIPGR